MVDMYREFIETPESVPEALKKDIDFYSGDRMGRSTGSCPERRLPGPQLRYKWQARLPRGWPPIWLTPNIWWRLTAHRLLVERQDRSVVPRLAAMASGHASPRPACTPLNALEGACGAGGGPVEAGTGGCPPRGTRPCRAAIGGVSRTGRTAGPHGGRPLASGTLPVGPESGGVLGSDGGPDAGPAGPGPLRRPLVSDRRAELEAGSSSAMLETLLASPAWLAREAAETVPFFAELASVIGAETDPRNRGLAGKSLEDRLFKKRRVADGSRRGPNPRTENGRSSPQGDSRR